MSFATVLSCLGVVVTLVTFLVGPRALGQWLIARRHADARYGVYPKMLGWIGLTIVWWATRSLSSNTDKTFISGGKRRRRL
jgi:hypothetical protein